jgi:PknH-like extracellular domain
MRRSWLTCGLCAVVVIAAGCVNTTAGNARPAGAESPGSSGAPTKPGQPLDHILLGAADINTVMGATDMQLMDSSNDMSDHSGDISDPQCLGALYNAEESVYSKTGWKDVADQVLTEPEDDSDHWVEQTAVQFPSAAAANAFRDSSMKQWMDCIGKTVMVDDGEYQFHWQFEGISSDNGTISQTTRQTDSDNWACQHALTAVDAYILEVSACGTATKDEAVTIVNRLADNAK